VVFIISESNIQVKLVLRGLMRSDVIAMIWYLTPAHDHISRFSEQGFNIFYHLTLHVSVQGLRLFLALLYHNAVRLLSGVWIFCRSRRYVRHYVLSVFLHFLRCIFGNPLLERCLFHIPIIHEIKIETFPDESFSKH
jgi:hypothetical protein